MNFWKIEHAEDCNQVLFRCSEIYLENGGIYHEVSSVGRQSRTEAP